MNTRRSKADWEVVAKECGFGSMRELLVKYYIERGMTTLQIGRDVLDVGDDRVIALLRTEGIPVRKRGGSRS